LIPLRAKSGSGGEWTSFNADVFEDAILGKLAEVPASEVFPENDRGGKVSTLSALHTAKEQELREFKEQIDADPRLLKRFRDTLIRLEEECETLAGELANAQREAASPLAEAWGEFTSLAALVREGDDDTRRRCRSVIRRTIESITCLFVGSKMVRKAAVRVQLKSGLHRDYLIGFLCRNRYRKNPPPPVVCSPPRAWASELGELDLRDRKHAAIAEKLLNALDVESLAMPTTDAESEEQPTVEILPEPPTVEKSKPAKKQASKRRRTLARSR
jgi:hypothetical protein